MVHPQHLAEETSPSVGLDQREHHRGDATRIDLGSEIAEARLSGREHGRCRGEYVPPVECASLCTDPELGVLDRHDRPGAAHHRHRRTEQTVVRTDEESPRRLGGDRSALGPDSGVDDGHRHALRQVLDRPQQRQRRYLDVPPREVVPNVDHARLRRDSGDDAVHHADELVAAPEVGEKGDEHARSLWLRARQCKLQVPATGLLPGRRLSAAGLVHRGRVRREPTREVHDDRRGEATDRGRTDDTDDRDAGRASPLRLDLRARGGGGGGGRFSCVAMVHGRPG